MLVKAPEFMMLHPRFLLFLALITGWMQLATSRLPAADAGPNTGPIRVLFLGHDKEHHNSNLYYPMLAQALGREAIYFDYVTSLEAALGDPEFLGRFDALLMYANYDEGERRYFKNLKAFVEQGGGFVPVHCASSCFRNIPEFDQLVGGRFKSHAKGVFSPVTIAPEHPAMQGVPEFEAWDESYFHQNHNETGRIILQLRDAIPGDPHTEAEPWTWVREEGKGRVFYTASGHDERVWALPEFHALLRGGILWSVGDERRASYEAFLAERPPLEYEARENIPNYEKRPEPLAYQLPLSPEASLQYTQAPMGFRLELFASEPDIVNPICLSWDAQGRLWVGETVDYPNEVRPEGGNDTIKVLEDTDGDGRADKVSVFADQLNIPTSITFANGGVIVAQAPDFLFLKDTDGDGKADVREVIMTGWGTRDTHAGPSNLRYGFDNWIWGTVGYSAFDGEVDGQKLKFGSGIFRFKPDGSQLEFLHQFNNNTWGLGFTPAGDVFGSTANRNPSFFGGLPQTVFSGKKAMSAKSIASNTAFHPITPRIRQADAFGEYTAACGHAFATSAAFPESMRDQVAFVCGPTGNLLGKFRAEPQGAGYVSQNEFAFLASADEWFSPVAAEVGPDGHLWVADWYNFIIQHNPAPTPERGGYQATTGPGNAHVNPNRDRQHGRIYRVIWEDAPPSQITSLDGASNAQLLDALDNDNLFWRLTAQRLLVESNAPENLPALRAKVQAGGVGAIHALWTLEGMGELDAPTHQLALLSPDPALKRNAIRALGSDAASIQLFYDTALVTDRDPQVRLAAFAKLASFPESATTRQAAAQLMRAAENREDEWLNLALRTAGANQALATAFEYGENLLPNPSFEEVQGDAPVTWKVRNYSGEAEHVLAGGEATHSGEHSLRITSQEGADTSWFAPVKLKPNTEYRLTGWIKTGNILGGHGALLNVHELQHEAKTNSLVRSNDWTQVESFFNSGDRTTATVNLLVGGWGKARGTAWFDDVALQEVIPITDTATKVVGDATRGRTIFHEHQVAACIRCHQLEGEGGPVGPPLDGIASRKDAVYLRESLTDPQATLAEGYQLQVSPMPPMNVLLSEQEFEDVLAYLLSLK